MDENLRYLVDNNTLKTPEIIDAFLNVDRKDFIPFELRDEAYGDYPLPIGLGQTISQPTTVAFMLELLEPKKGDKILDVGSGSGWTTALLSRIAGSTGQVWGVEIIPTLVTMGQNNLRKYRFKNASIVQASQKLGLPEKAPFNKILVSASASTLPRGFIDQLKIGGRLVIPVGHTIFKVTKKSETETIRQRFHGFAFVPLVQKYR